MLASTSTRVDYSLVSKHNNCAVAEKPRDTDKLSFTFDTLHSVCICNEHTHLGTAELHKFNVAVQITLHFYLRDAVTAVLATATCLAGWLGGWVGVRHTPVLIKTAKPS